MKKIQCASDLLWLLRLQENPHGFVKFYSGKHGFFDSLRKAGGAYGAMYIQ